jgi:hypothetical protein
VQSTPYDGRSGDVRLRLSPPLVVRCQRMRTTGAPSIRRSRVNLSRAVATWAILCSAAMASRTHALRGIRGKGGITRRRTGHGARALAFRTGDLSLTAAFRALSQSLLLVQVMRPALAVPLAARHKRFVSTRVALADRQCNTGPKDRRANWQRCTKSRGTAPRVKRKVRRTPHTRAPVVELHAYARQHPDRPRRARWRANASPLEESGRVESMPSPAETKKRSKRGAPI